MNETPAGLFVLIAMAILALSAAGAPAAQAASCAPCDVALERCSANCFGLEGKAETSACLISCDNAAAICSCDEKVTLRSEDIIPASIALSAEACHSTTPCGTAYPSCASWSGYSDCDDSFCGASVACGECIPEIPRCFPGDALKQSRERFRVCFNALGESCTEYQRTTVTLGCGC